MKRIVRMPPGLVAEKVLKRAQRAIDRPISRLELRNSGVSLTGPTSFSDRLILREIRQSLRSRNDLVVYDIGAHTGRYARAIASASSVCQVVSFEPIPESFEQLVQATSHLGKVLPINLALGDTSREAKFLQNNARASSSLLPMLARHSEEFPFTAGTHEIMVPVRRLDDIIHERGLRSPDVIKLDVQGYEDRVIRGGPEAFGSARWCHLELSLIALYEDSLQFDELYRIVADLGFTLAEFTDQLFGKSGNALQVNVLFERR
jgi:FkbM family methyltransferase